jgi:hypothetical protein
MIGPNDFDPAKQNNKNSDENSNEIVKIPDIAEMSENLKPCL